MVELNSITTDLNIFLMYKEVLPLLVWLKILRNIGQYSIINKIVFICLYCIWIDTQQICHNHSFCTLYYEKFFLKNANLGHKAYSKVENRNFINVNHLVLLWSYLTMCRTALNHTLTFVGSSSLLIICCILFLSDLLIFPCKSCIMFIQIKFDILLMYCIDNMNNCLDFIFLHQHIK